MSDVQRWDMFAEVGVNEPVKYDMWEAVEGRYVLYADHVAAVAAAEQRGFREAARIAAEVIPSDFYAGYADALADARDAVEQLGCNGQCGCSVTIPAALAAIDALSGGDNG